MKAWIARNLGSVGRRWARRAATERVLAEEEILINLQWQASTDTGTELVPREEPDIEQLIEERTQQILNGEVDWP